MHKLWQISYLSIMRPWDFDLKPQSGVRELHMTRATFLSILDRLDIIVLELAADKRSAMRNAVS